MARVQSVTLIDDLDGGEAAETIIFSLDGKEMEIDLSHHHAGELRDALAPFIGAARKVSGRRSHARVNSRPTTDPEENSRIRAWALEQGLNVAERGRIPSQVIKAYHGRGSAPAVEFQAVEDKPRRRTGKKN